MYTVAVVSVAVVSVAVVSVYCSRGFCILQPWFLNSVALGFIFIVTRSMCMDEFRGEGGGLKLRYI